jgi:hypothetical protein
MFYVYLISENEEVSNGYVGVTNNPMRRWKEHLKSYYSVGNAIRNGNWSFENNMKILFSGSECDCFDFEKKLRPFPFIGLNESVGGQGGNKYKHLPEEKKKSRNQKISDRLKNREHTWGSKVSKTRKERGLAKGLNNNKAKTWKIVSPEGETSIVKGNLQDFCNRNNILRSCLRRYVGKVVPVVEKNKLGGYRPKNETSESLRENTVGWSLFILEN